MIHHFGGEFKVGVTHHCHHKKSMGSYDYAWIIENLMITPRRIITHFFSLMTFWMKSPVVNYTVLGMAIMVITKSKLRRKTS